MELLYLPPLDFTVVELQDFKNIFFPEHLSMTASNITLKQSISAQLKISLQIKISVPFIFVQQLNSYVHTLINFMH